MTLDLETIRATLVGGYAATPENVNQLVMATAHQLATPERPVYVTEWTVTAQTKESTPV